MAHKNKGSAITLRAKGRSYVETFNAKVAKGDVKNTAIKSLVDVILGATAGAGIGAVSGKQAKFVGLGLIVLGHYMGDASGVLRVAGASAIAYGIAKHFDNSELAGTVDGFTLAGESTKAKTRLTAFKDEVLASFYLDKIFKKKEGADEAVSGNEMGAIDMSELDFYDNYNEHEANLFSATQQLPERSVSAAPSSDESELAYALFDDEPDFSKM